MKKITTRGLAARLGRLYVEAMALGRAVDPLASDLALELVDRTVDVVVTHVDLDGTKLDRISSPRRHISLHSLVSDAALTLCQAPRVFS